MVRRQMICVTILRSLISLLMIIALLAVGLSTAQNAPSIGAPPSAQTNASNASVKISPGDLLQISVYGAPDFTHEVRVADNGEIMLPLVRRVKVAGLTPIQLSEQLKKRLEDEGYFTDPQVSVNIKEYSTQGIVVLGEVQKPGIYPLLGQRTLFDAISAAQGTTQMAGNTATLIHRDRPDQPETVQLMYDSNGSVKSDVAVVPGDKVVVHRAGMVYVVGDVHKPLGIALVNSDLSVLQAIAVAEGVNPDAKLDDAKLIRKTPDGQQEMPLQLKKMLSAKAPDLELRPDDIIFVPNNAAKSAARRGIEAAIQTATGIAIYRH